MTFGTLILSFVLAVTAAIASVLSFPVGAVEAIAVFVVFGQVAFTSLVAAQMVARY